MKYSLAQIDEIVREQIPADATETIAMIKELYDTYFVEPQKIYEVTGDIADLVPIRRFVDAIATLCESYHQTKNLIESMGPPVPPEGMN